MTKNRSLGLLLLHALPLDGSMWADYMDFLPGMTTAPTLYSFGETLEEWAVHALATNPHERLILVGCSVGGSCAIEIARAAPDRVAALVLVGTKARHDPDPNLRSEALQILRDEGIGCAWNKYWAGLFAKSTDRDIIAKAMTIALKQDPKDIIRGVSVFHSRKSRAHVLNECAAPIDIITGEGDTAPGLQMSEAMAKTTKYGRLHVIPDCGHYVPLEQPSPFRTILSNIVADHRR